MNVFYLDEDPRSAAQMMVNKHVVKMILESAQLLSTAHRVMDGLQVEVTLEKDGKFRKKKVWVLGDSRNETIYNATHMNHPCAKWCRSSIENYWWLVEHMYGLIDEYKYRYEKDHKVNSSGLAYLLQSPPYNLKEYDFTIPPSAMAESYIVSTDPVANYRNYYKNGKAHLHTWSKREKPDWI